MIPSHATVQHIDQARAVIVLVTVGIVFYWRVLLRAALALAAVAAIAGVLMLVRSIHG